jgi:hypothetical protein
MVAMTLEQRVEKLERQNRWMRLLGAMGLAVVAAVFLVAQGKAAPKAIEAEQFVVKDAKGRVRAKLGRLAEGTFGLVIHDAEGNKRIGVLHWDTGTGFVVLGCKGEKSIVLAEGEGGNVGLSLNENVADRPGASLGAAPHGYVDLQLWSKGNKRVFEMVLDRHGQPRIRFGEYGGETLKRWLGK